MTPPLPQEGRRSAPPPVLLLAGLDPSGGAGLALDLAVLRSLGIRGLPVPTSLTVQNLRRFREARAVEADLLERMVRAVLEEGPPRAVKVGLLAGPGQAVFLAGLLGEVLPEGIPLVVDPILRASLASGEEGEREAALARTLGEAFLPLGPILTPNRPELSALAGEEEEGAARTLLERGARAVVLKGGHREEGAYAADRLYLPGGRVREFRRERDSLGEVHGTGCAFSSALAGLLAAGWDLEAAVEQAGERTAGLRRTSLDLGGRARLLFP